MHGINKLLTHTNKGKKMITVKRIDVPKEINFTISFNQQPKSNDLYGKGRIHSKEKYQAIVKLAPCMMQDLIALGRSKVSIGSGVRETSEERR